MSLSPLTAITPSTLGLGLADHRPPVPSRPTSDDVARAAKQFEAILLRQFLAPAIDPLMSGGALGGQGGGGGGVYGYLLTDTLANSLAQGGGLGLAKMLQTQLGGTPPSLPDSGSPTSADA